MANSSGIHIKKSNKGKFTESAKRAGMGVQEYARHVLANKGNYDATTVRRANFARNAKKWHHADGGLLYNPFNFGGYIPLDGVVQLPPQYGLGGTIDYEDVMPIGGAIRTRFKEKASPFRNLKQTLKAMPTRGEWMDRISENIYPQSNRTVREKVNKGDYVPELTLPLNINGNIVYGTGNMPAWYDYQQQAETRNPYSCGGRMRKFPDGGNLVEYDSVNQEETYPKYYLQVPGAYDDAKLDFMTYKPNKVAGKTRKYMPENMMKIQDALIKANVPYNSRVAILSTILQESGGDPNAKSSSGKYRGIIQWDKSRMADEYVGDLDWQINKIISDINDIDAKDWTDGGKRGPRIATAKRGREMFHEASDPYEAAVIFNKAYVRPGNSDSWYNRARQANDIDDIIGYKNAGDLPSGPVPGFWGIERGRGYGYEPSEPISGKMACGGHIKADGGDLGRSNGAYWPSGLTYVDAGGTHEQNPNEGVQMGEDNQGTPNLVEQGEVIYNDYVFSNRLTPNKSFFENGKKGKNDLAGLIGLLPKKYKRNTYAKIAEDMGKEIRGRENDPISKRGLERNLSNLEALQETQRAMNGRKGTQQLQTPGYDMAQQPVQQYGMDQYGMQNEIQPIQETGIGTSMEQQPMIGGLGGRLHGRKFGGEENTNQPNYALRVAQSRRKNYPLSVYDSYVPENDYMYNYINQDYLDQLENGTPIVDMFHLGFTPRYGLQWSPVNVPPVYIYQGGNGSAGSNGSAGGNGGSGSYQTSSSNNSEVPVMESANANDNGNSAGTNNPVATVEGNGQSNSVPVIPQYSTQPEKSNIPEYDTRLRYAPVAGSLLSALGTVLQPLDLQEANDLFRMAGNVRTPSVRARMLSNYVKPRLMDRNYALNPVLANAGATRRMINGTNGGNRMAGLVAAGYNAQNAVGNTLAQVNDYNNKILLNAAQFNRATDKYNSQQALSADTANADYMMNAQQLRNNLLTGALGERGKQKDARGEAISSAVSQAFNNLGAIGTQNFNANLANKNPLNRGYYITGQGGVAYDPYISSLYGLQPSLAASQTTALAEGQKGTLPTGQEVIFKDGKWDFTSACGGRLMTKKSKRR